VLVGSAGWTSRSLPAGLSGMYLSVGTIALFVYLLPNIEGLAAFLVFILSIWQGVVLWNARAEEKDSGRIWQ